MITLIKNAIVITMDEDRNKKYEKLDIVIENNIISKVVKKYKGNYDKLIDASNKVVMPGLINAHTHLGMSIFRATNDNMDLNTWLNEKIWPVESKFNDKDVYLTTLLSCIEMIKTGTTTSNDMYFCHEGAIKAIKETKVRNMFPLYLIGDVDDKKIEELKEFYYKNNDNELINFTISPHSLYTCSTNTLIKAKLLADSLNLPIHIHFCENEKEVEDIKKIYKKDPVFALESLGYLENKLILAHCTYISLKELKILKNKNISFVHNPVSNLNLACGIANIKKYVNEDINVCLGTDGQGSGNNMNMFYHMSFVDYLQKALYKDPCIFSSYDVLKMVTVNAAKALGLESEIGKIKEGYKADIIILDLNKIENYPYYDLINNVVHNVSVGNVDTTIINGEILLINHKLKLNINETKIKNEIDNILKKVNL
jgi:5-methylthioadenosine/S-adenosylhomocysteine deaminase